MAEEDQAPIVLPRARVDIVEIYLHIHHDNELAAARFLDAAEAAIERIGSMPAIGKLVQIRSGPLRDLRIWPIPGFDHFLVFYTHTDQTPVIVRILHSARDFEDLDDL